MDPKVNIDCLIPRDDIDVHNSNIQFDLVESIASSRDTFHLLSFTPHDILYLDLFNQISPPVIYLDTFDSQFVGSHVN